MFRSSGVLKGHAPVAGEVFSSMAMPRAPRHQPSKAPYQVKPEIRLPSPSPVFREELDSPSHRSGKVPSMLAETALRLNAGLTGLQGAIPCERPEKPVAKTVPSQVLQTALKQLADSTGKSQLDDDPTNAGRTTIASAALDYAQSN
mmetsp:Transcript_17733/g.41124  ORF Transcript_17733/g.41124 Transcript_17733/m.41124 type:complete len:146 (-) Transcript_17733:80-517(-)